MCAGRTTNTVKTLLVRQVTLELDFFSTVPETSDRSRDGDTEQIGTRNTALLQRLTLSIGK